MWTSKINYLFFLCLPKFWDLEELRLARTVWCVSLVHNLQGTFPWSTDAISTDAIENVVKVDSQGWCLTNFTSLTKGQIHPMYISLPKTSWWFQINVGEKVWDSKGHQHLHLWLPSLKLTARPQDRPFQKAILHLPTINFQVANLMLVSGSVMSTPD